MEDFVTPRVLAIDTTSALGSFALVGPAGVAAEIAVREPDGFSPILFDVIKRLLDETGWSLNLIDVFAAASGPGSFTGIRVGLAAVKGLAEAQCRPAFGISNLQAIASLGEGELRAPWIDARRGEIYGAVYDAKLEVIAEPVVMPFDRWRLSLPQGHQLLPGDGLSLAAAVGRLAIATLDRGERPDPIALDALYVRRSDAEMFHPHAHEEPPAPLRL